MSDVELINYGSIMLVHPMTDTGREWLTDNTDGTWFGSSLCVEPRYLPDLVEGMQADGLTVY